MAVPSEPMRRGHDLGFVSLAALGTQAGILGLLILAAAAALGGQWALAHGASLGRPGLGFLLLLCVGIAGSRLWAVRVGQGTKVYMTGVPVYLLCALFAPPLAGLAVGSSMLVRELSVCRSCGNTAADVGAQVGRWVVLAWAVSALQVALSGPGLAYASVAAVLALWLGDVVTSPLVFTPMTGMRPLAVMAMVVQRSYAGELVQYLIGMLGLFVVRSGVLGFGELWMLPFMAALITVPIALLYLYLRSVDDLKHLPPAS